MLFLCNERSPLTSFKTCFLFVFQQPSGNVDDSGYFSVQVINSALDFWGLDLVPYNSTEPAALMAQIDPA